MISFERWHFFLSYSELAQKQVKEALLRLSLEEVKDVKSLAGLCD
jgi:hypothetical protein